jgi:RNA polymerase sigma factor (sigma-70 family)
MSSGDTNSLLQHLRRLAATARAGDATDGQLVESFVAGRDETAFAALFRRHAPMVLGLCRRVLRNDHDAEDAFQATFLVLAQKARSLHARDQVSSWLYGVAYRTALKARGSAARLRAREAAAPARQAADPLAEMSVGEAQGIVDEELARLPEKFRAPLVLCCLEGLARDEAAGHLGWTLGVLKSRLEQARELLRARLTRRGVTLAGGLLSLGLLGNNALAAVPAALAEATVRAAALTAAGAAATSVVAPQVMVLANGVMRSMLMTKVKIVSGVVLALAVVTGGAYGLVRAAAPAPEPQAAAVRPAAVAPQAPAGGRVQLKPEALERWGRSEVLVVAKLEKAVGGPVGLSEPPLFNHTLQFQVSKVLRGSFKAGDRVTAGHSVRQKFEPIFPVGKECLIALSSSQGRWTAKAVVEAKAEDLAQAEAACALPLGWALEKGRLLSPWAKLGRKGWPAEARGEGPLVCAETGRPSLLVGPGVEFTVEPVPPAVKLKFGNPDGDGEFRVTVKNTTDKPVTLPALVSDGQTPLWEESLVILCQDKVYTIPGARGVSKAPRVTVLNPGQSVSGVVNVLGLQGPEWPRGGYRIEFQFCLGEKSTTRSFYYTSKHHDPLRAKVAAGK